MGTKFTDVEIPLAGDSKIPTEDTNGNKGYTTPLAFRGRHRIKVAASQDQVVASGVLSPINFGRVVIDSAGSSFDAGSSSITVPRAGFYNISCGIGATFTASANRIAINVKKQGYTQSRNAEVGCEAGATFAGATAFPFLRAAGYRFLGKGEIISVNLYHNAGSNQSTQSGDYDRNPSLMLEEDDYFVGPYTSRRIVGAGDSIMAGTVCGPDNSMLNFLSSDTVNLGVSGRKMGDILSHVSEITAAASPGSDLVINCGINDLILPSPDLSALTSALTSVVVITGSLFRRVIWVTPVPGSSYASNNNPDFEEDRQTLINMAEDIPGLIVARADQDPLIGTDGCGNDIEFFYEKLHLTPHGEWRTASIIAPYLS